MGFRPKRKSNIRWMGSRISISCEKRQRIQDKAKNGRLGTGDMKEENRASSGSAAVSIRLSILGVILSLINGQKETDGPQETHHWLESLPHGISDSADADHFRTLPDRTPFGSVSTPRGRRCRQGSSLDGL